MQTPSNKLTANGELEPNEPMNDDCKQQDDNSNTNHVETKMIKSSQAGETRNHCQDSNNNNNNNNNSDAASASTNSPNETSQLQSSVKVELDGGLQPETDDQVIAKSSKMVMNNDGSSNKSKSKSGAGGFLRSSSKTNKEDAKSKGSKTSSNSGTNKIQEGQANTTTGPLASGGAKGQRENHQSSSSSSSTKPYKSLVEELKIFQNSNLLNQEDPLEQLHQQLNELIKEDESNSRSKNSRFRPTKSTQQLKTSEARPNLPPLLPLAANGENNYINNKFDQSLSSSMQSSANQPKQAINFNENDGLMRQHDSGFGCGGSGGQGSMNTNENLSTIKKGVLWQQQNYDKFHQRLFSRWKKRYFILTTDYLVCFKRSSSKVGRSEMGKFLYKTSLGDVHKIEWLKPNKSDKGAIIVQLRGQCFDLHLWCKRNLDEWMFMLKESIERLRMRRSIAQGADVNSSLCHLSSTNVVNHQDSKTTTTTTTTTRLEEVFRGEQNDELYENTTANKSNIKAQEKIPTAIELSKIAREGQQQTGAQVTSNQEDVHHSLGSKEKRRTATEEGEEKEERQQQSCSKQVATGTRDEPLKPASHRPREPIERNPRESGEGAINVPPEAPTSLASRKEAKHCGETLMIYDEEARREKQQRQRDVDDDQDHEEQQQQQKQKQVNSLADEQKTIELSPEEPTRRAPTKQPVQSNQRGSRGSQSTLSATGTPTGTTSSGSGSSSSSSSSNSTSAAREGTSHSRGGASTNENVKQKHDNDNQLRHKQKNRAAISVANNGTGANTNESAKSARDPSQGGQPAHPNESSGNKGQMTTTSTTTTNLIRRDDSWQSLVSLNRVGRVSSMQVAQRSLYAQHIMPEGIAGRTQQQQPPDQPNGHQPRQQQQHSIINIESTVTPIRAGPLLLRQQSMQSPFNGQASRKLAQQRPLPLIGQHAASFDVPLQQQQQQPPPPPTSYQHKLLQLQMLHQQSRGLNGADNNNTNDYQIYAPGSTTTTNHYGYYSMRSNLKSAASEFSFIRPSASNLQPSQQPLLSQQHQQQSTLPHLNSSYLLEQSNLRSALVSQSKSNGNNNNNNNTEHQLAAQEKQQHLQHLQVANDTGAGHQITLAELAAPNRELPLKPNRRRAPTTGDGQHHLTNGAGKGSSLGSSIVCFFRRAFSRRSKRRRRSKMLMADSCSSSMGAFDDANFAHQVVLPSAFSTGSKSIQDADHNNNNNNNHRRQQHQQPSQPQRMVDMIEAFASKTNANHPEEAPALGYVVGGRGPETSTRHQIVEGAVGRPPMNNSMSFYGSPRMTPQRMPAYQQQVQNNKNNNNNIAASQFGSPLHKSNSISTTMGLTGAGLNNHDLHNYHLMSRQQQQQGLYYDNETPITVSQLAAESPMMTRSAKVMSANLTPLFARKEAMIAGESQFLLSPRTNRHQDLLGAAPNQHQSTRPSSIYGQPSMISSSPSQMINRVGDEQNSFGLHRSSIHGTGHHHQLHRATNQSPVVSDLVAVASGGGGGGGGGGHRRHQMKLSHLDPTREVAEELTSPTTETARGGGPMDLREANYHDEDDHSKHLQQTRLRDSNSMMMMMMMHESPSMGAHKFRRSQAIVNPILQSPTMDAIYDNHPMPSQRFQQQQQLQETLMAPTTSYSSHYDNQHLANETWRLSGQMELDYRLQRADLQPSIRCTPSRQPTFAYEAPGSKERSTVDMMLLANGKPSAIVAPTTPNHHNNHYHYQQHQQQQQQQSNYSVGRLVNNTNGHHSAANASPMSSRRLLANHHQAGQSSLYQQSPLVSSRQTRILNKPDGTQVTYASGAGGRLMTMSEDSGGQPVVNIAGAPGINLEPSLAASLLRGTNINAYESSTAARSANLSSSGSQSKAFLVSTRLSKSMASENQLSNDELNNNNNNNKRAELENNTVSSKSSREESSLSGTSSSSSSRRRPSIGRVASATNNGSQRLVDGSGGDDDDDDDDGNDEDEDNDAQDGSERSKSNSRAVGRLTGSSRASSGGRASKNSSSTTSSSRSNCQNGTGIHQHQQQHHLKPRTQQQRQRRGSSLEHSDEVASSSHNDSLDEPETERNWITSKLVQ